MNCGINRKACGVTTVEMLVTLGVISVLAGVAVVSFPDLGTKAKEKVLESQVASINSAIEIYLQLTQQPFPLQTPELLG